MISCRPCFIKIVNVKEIIIWKMYNKPTINKWINKVNENVEISKQTVNKIK